jgi:hypothetical protein
MFVPSLSWYNDDFNAKVGGKVGFRTGRMPERTSIIAARPYLRDKTLHHEARASELSIVS